MPRVIGWSRYLIIIPIIGLLVASAALFIFGGIGLIRTVIEGVMHSFQGAAPAHGEALPIEVEIVEYVHRFLIGTVLFITAVGFYQLFIDKIEFPHWLRIESTEELETNLIGVTVVVLAVHFMGVVFTLGANELMNYGIGIAFPIAALSLFIGLRAWSTSKAKISERKIELIDEHAEELIEVKRQRIDTSVDA
jgi:uncharacterized membrane protein YqhA